MITAILEESKNFAILNETELVDKFNAYKQNNDNNAYTHIVMSNMRLVVKIAHYYKNKFNVALDDLVQAGYIGLTQGIEKYEPTKGAKLISVARHYIANAMKDEIAKNCGAVSVSRKTAKASDVSLNATVNDDDGNKELGDYIIADEFDTTFEKSVEYDFLNYIITNKLNEVQHAVIRARFYDDLTLQDIAEKMGISKERVRQIQNTALSIIKQNYL